MQLFINNWSTELTAPASDSAVEISVDPAEAAKLTGLGSGDYYLLTLATVVDGVETGWEVVKVTGNASGALTVARGVEGAALSWPSGAPVSARLTAGTIESLQSAGGSSTTIIGIDYPDAAPPAIGAHYIYGDAVFIAVGDSELENWHQVSGVESRSDVGVWVGHPDTLVVGRAVRKITVSSLGTIGASLPIATIQLPNWQAPPSDITVMVMPEVDGLTTNVDLDFGSGWENCEVFAESSGTYTASRSGNVVSLVVTEAANFTMHKFDVYPDGSGLSLYVEIRATPAGILAAIT